MKFSVNIKLTIILKVRKKQGFTLYLKGTFFEKRKGMGQMMPHSPLSSRFKVKKGGRKEHLYKDLVLTRYDYLKML